MHSSLYRCWLIIVEERYRLRVLSHELRAISGLNVRDTVDAHEVVDEVAALSFCSEDIALLVLKVLYLSRQRHYQVKKKPHETARKLYRTGVREFGERT